MIRALIGCALLAIATISPDVRALLNAVHSDIEWDEELRIRRELEEAASKGDELALEEQVSVLLSGGVPWENTPLDAAIRWQPPGAWDELQRVLPPPSADGSDKWLIFPHRAWAST